MPSSNRYGAPIYLSTLDAERGYTLARVPFSLREGNDFSEDWLQECLFRNPDVLPIGQIDALAAPAVALCRELRTGAGDVDIALVSPGGRLTLVECKLWRNPEARRVVVAQILDYARAVARWTFEDLQKAVIAATGDKRSLIQRVKDAGVEVDETIFHDSVQIDLSAGRINLAIVGDGIQEGVEQLVDYLTRDVTLRYRLGLIELAVYRMPEGAPPGFILQPRLLARTVEVKRVVVQTSIEVANSSQVETDDSEPSGRPPRIALDDFMSTIRAVDPILPGLVAEFLKLIEPLSIRPSLQRGLTLRWLVDGVGNVNFGTIFPNGTIATNYICGTAEDKFGRLSIGESYLSEIARMLPDASIRKDGKPWVWKVVIGDALPPAKPLLSNANQWRNIIAETQEKLREARPMPEA